MTTVQGTGLKMILPDTRASFERADAMALVKLLGGDAPSLRDGGMDAMLDDPRVLNAVLTDPELSLRPEVVFYVLVRQSLLEARVEDRLVADYLTSLVIAFGRERRAYRVSDRSDEEFFYLVDILDRLDGASAHDAFLLRTHLGNYALWLTGLFPDHVSYRVRRRGAPPMRYFEEMGSSGFSSAAEMREARELGLEGLYSAVARNFSTLRAGLNRLSDRVMWRGVGNPVDRLLREVSWRVSKA